MRMYRWLRRRGAVVGLLVLAFVLPVSAAEVVSEPASPAIVVKGNHRIDADAVRSAFEQGSSEKLDAEKIDAALKRLYATGQFEDVRIATSAGHLVVTVVENPVIDRLAFEGNVKIKDDELKSHIKSKARDPLSRPVVQQDVAAILDMYRHAGRFDTRVDPKIIKRSDDRADLVFEVHEGAKTGIKSIVFVGNKAYSARTLKDQIKTGETNVLSFLLNNDLYDSDRLEADRELLRRFYLKHGFLDMSVVSVEPRYDGRAKAITVTFTIAEGEQFRLGRVDVQSAVPGLDPSLLRTRLRTAAGDIYNVDLVDRSIDDMTMLASAHGHPFVRVRDQVDRHAEKHSVDLTYRAEPGPRVYVEKIEISGNIRTRDYVIRREFDLGEGDPCNRVLLDRAERRLKNLGYFKDVRIKTEPGSAPDQVVVHVEVEEQQTGDFSIAGGYSTTDGIIAEVSVGERNLFGTGLYVKAAVSYGQYAKGIDLGLVEPYFLGDRMSLGLDVFYKQSTASTYQSYGSESYGAGVRFGMPLSEDLSVTPHYSIYNQSLSLDPTLLEYTPTNLPPGCYTNCVASAATRQAALEGPTWVSMGGNTVTWNTLDNSKNPTNGINASVNEDLAGLGGDVKFVRTTGDIRYYQPVAGDVTGMLRMQSGYITPWGGQTLPVLNGFFGGPQLVRGFAPNGFGPRDLTPGTTMDNIGGTRYWASTAELDAPVPYIPASSGLKVGVFADAGSLWGYGGQTSFPGLSQSMMVADTNTIRSSIGASMIWDSPFGPLRVDYAFPVTKASYDITQRFHFGAGGF